MRKIFIYIIIITSFSVVYGQENEKFYYHFDEKIFLNKVDNEFAVYLQEPIKNKNGAVINLDEYELVNKIREDLLILILSERQRDELLSSTYVKAITPHFKTNQNMEFIYSNEIVLKPKLGVSTNRVNAVLEKYKLMDIRITKRYKLVSCDKKSDALQLSNLLFETGLFAYVHPNFSSNYEPSDIFPSDPYFVNQFYLHNTGQATNHGNSGTADADIDAPEAWDITLGHSDVVIAVVDQGVTSNHPDLPNTRQVRLNGSNIGARVDNTSSNDPSPTGNDNHGNACAGIIAASHNNEGVAGIAPNCKIMPIRIVFRAGLTNADFADAISFGADNGADIISNSWGGGSPSSVIETAIVDAIANGRNGKGAVVVFSAGNFISNAFSPSFPGAANIAGLICVGASDRNDDQSLYSPTGSAVDVVAPSHRAYNSQDASESFEIWTIDIPGTAGYNQVNSGNEDGLNAVNSTMPSSGTNHLSYTGRMGGTSAACPQVAAVAALLLSENPCFTALEIETIIKRNADKVGGFDYQADPNRPGHSTQMGFGRLNAYRALIDPEVVYVQNETFSTPSNFIKSIGTIIVGSNVTSSIPFGDVVVTSSGSLRLIAGRHISIEETFETEIGADFVAEIISYSNDCSVWDAAFVSPPDKGSWTPDYNSPLNNETIVRTVEDNYKFRIYPNPSSDVLNVKSDIENSSVDLLNVDGKLISTYQYEGYTGQYDVSALSAGLYFVRLQTPKGYKYLRFVKQ